MQTLAQIIAPVAGGVLLQGIGTWSPGVLGSVLMVWTAFVAWRYVLHKPEFSCDAPALR
jgi:hypothetical protein